MTNSTAFTGRLGLESPIIQAPMAGVSTPQMAAAVSNAGGLGSVALGAAGAEAGARMIAELRALTSRPFNVNLFTHDPAGADEGREAAWLKRLAPQFARFGAKPPPTLHEIYTSFRRDPAMLRLLLETKPAVVSFHFGLAEPDQIVALKAAGIFLLASATNIAEARRIAAAGIDAVIAQGSEAGGHRGMFDPGLPDEGLGTAALTRQLVRESGLPVIAAGGIMDGAEIAALLALGASAAQLGTAFIASPESAADAGYRAALLRPDAETEMTRVISGRPARSLVNCFTRWGRGIDAALIPDYPIAYDAGKALHAAAKAQGEPGYGAQWAGSGVRRARVLPAGELVATLRAELSAARRSPAAIPAVSSAARRRSPC